MSTSELQIYTKAFMKTQEGKSRKTYEAYAEGLDVLMTFFEGYYESEDDAPIPVADIDPEDIDYILSFFVIRKFIAGVTLRLHAARAVKAFFTYLASIDAYDKERLAQITAMTKHYATQYPRIEKLEQSLWDAIEGVVDSLMKLPKKQREEKLAGLKEKVKDATLAETGYVSIEKIEKGLVYGRLMESEEGVGPVKLDPVSLELVERGDIINMITLRKLKNKTAWEIVELGYVYPRPFNG